jgi:hypothetical protein
MKIMKLLNDSSMNPVTESNGASPCRTIPRGSTSDPAAPFARIPEDSANTATPNGADPSERLKARSEVVGLGVAVVAVLGGATLWGWTIMELCGLLLHAESVTILVRSTFPLS